MSTLIRKTRMKRVGRLAKVGKQKAKRQARNREYYASAEWRAKRKAVFERDGYQCTEEIKGIAWLTSEDWYSDDPLEEPPRPRCPNRGEIVNGKVLSAKK